MTQLKTRLPVKALAVLMAILMIFSTISVMFTVSAALSDQEGGGEGTWYEINTALSLYSEYLNDDGTIAYSGQATSENSSYKNSTVHYSIYMPKGYEDNYATYKASGKKLATMLVLSGGSDVLNAGNDTYSAMARITGFNYLADEQGIVLIYLKMTDDSLNPSYYWNFFLNSFQERSKTSGSNPNRPLGQISDMVIDVKEQLNTEFGDIITDNGKERTYVAGFSAGCCLAANMISVYPDRFEGAALVAGMPFGMFQTWADGYSYGGYANAMYGGDDGDLNSWSKSYGWNISYSWDRQTTSTYANRVTSAWSTAGISSASTNADAPRIIVLHGENDNVVNIVNGEQMASAFAIAYGASTTGSSYNQRATYDLEEENTGYTARYYGLNSSLLGEEVNTAHGYSKARSSRLAFMVFDGNAHTWISDHSQSVMSNADNSASGVSSAMGGTSEYYDYNDIIWDFFEGEPSYYEAEPIEPENAIAPNTGALYVANNGNKTADVVTTTGLTNTNLPLAPDYLTDGELYATGTEWNFNFDLSQKIYVEDAKITDPRYKLTIESIKVYQNVWVSEDGVTVNMGYDVIDSASITQGSSTPVSTLNGVTKLASWTGTPKFNTNQLVTEIPISEELSDEIIEKGVLSIVNYANDDSTNYNVASPVIVITYGQTLADPTEAIPGDGITKTSVKLFPTFAYNSAAGYNAPDSAANETKTYTGIEGHLIGTAKKYAVGVYNAGDNNDKIYYSYDLYDYTILNNNTIQSITIDFAIEGNPYYSKEDVGVKVMAIGNMYWETEGEQPTDYITLPETYTLSKGERIEGQITIDSANIINRVNNLGGFTLVFENTASNEHYYFLVTMPTITVNYEHAKGKPVTELTGRGSRTELGYDDFVGDNNLYESGETTITDTHVISSVTVTNPKYDNNNTNSSSASNNISSSNLSNRYRTTFGAYQVYSEAIEQDIIDSIKEQFPGMTEGVDYWITLSDVKLVSADVAITAAKSSGSYRNEAYGYVYYHPTAQSGSTAAFATADGEGPILTATITSNNTTAVNGEVEGYAFNMDVSTDDSYLWLKSYGSTSSSYYVSTSVPTLTNVKLSYSATVSLTAPPIVEDSGEATIGSVSSTSTPQGLSSTTNNSNFGTQTNNFSNATNTGTDNFTYNATVADYNIYQMAYDKVITDLKTKYGFTDAQVSEKVSDIKITFQSVDATVYAKLSGSSNSSLYANLYYSAPTAAGYTLSSFTTSTSGATAAWGTSAWRIQSTTVSSKTQTITFGNDDQFTEDNPYLLLRAYGTMYSSNQSSSRRYVYVSVPQLTNLKFTWTANVNVGEGGGSTEDQGTVTPNIPTVVPGQTVSGTAVTGQTYSVTSSQYTGQWTRDTATSSSAIWGAYSNYSSGNIYGLTLNYDVEAIKTAISSTLTTTETMTGYQFVGFDIQLTSLRLNGSAGGTRDKSFKYSSGETVYNKYDSAMSNWSSTSTFPSTSYDSTIDISNLTGSYINVLFAASQASSNYGISSMPTATITYTYTPLFAPVQEPLQTVTSGTNESTRVTTFAIVTTTDATSVQIKANGSVVKESSSFETNSGYRVFMVEIPVPTVDTTYTVYALVNGTADSKTLNVSVKGIPEPVLPDEPVEEEILMDAVDPTFSGSDGDSYKVPDEYYDETRTTTSTTSKPYTAKLFPTSGYIVGTNSNYYTNNSEDYWTGPNRNTGSPQANVALDTTKTSLPVSYLGYAYMNYDVSDYFDKEEPKTLISDNTANPEIIEDEETGVKSTVITKVYQETVVSGIRVNTIKAQEGYTGGWANRYTVSGSTGVMGGAEWTSTSKPEDRYQILGSGDVTYSMGTIGDAANINSVHLAAARENGYVTIWVNNTGSDWSSRYYPSAWLLVEMPTVTVTYKTITYTEKYITETKKVTQATESTTSEKVDSLTSSSVVNAENGYLYGSSTSYYTTSSSYYRTSTTSDKGNYQAQAQVNMSSSSLNNGNFAVTYMGSGYAEYDISSAVALNGLSSEITTDEIITAVINGKETEVRREVIEYTQREITSITVSGTVQAGFTGNNSAANSYNVTNEFYIGSFTDWSGNSYPADSEAGWVLISTISNIKIASQDLEATISESENGDVYAAILENGRLTIRVDNTYNNWNNQYKNCAWTLVSLPDIVVNYKTTTWTEEKLTQTQATDTFKPEYEVYAQYRFTGANGESYSKTKYLGAMEGYGAEAIITPYAVAPGATHGTVYALFSSPVGANDKPTNSVVITEKESDTENYKLKRAYIEQTGQDVATVIDNGDGTYTLDTTLTSDMLKTNDTYKIRVIFEYESEAETPIPEDELIKVNLHAVFENYDANGNKLETVGQIDTINFAQLTDLSYVLSLDDVAIPFGDYNVGGTDVSAIAGSNRIYTLDVNKTEVRLAQSTTTTQTGTYEFASSTNYEAKTYLDITGGTPALGDILVVTYNGAETEASDEIDVYLYYKATPQYDVTVNYEFDIVNENGDSITTQKYTYNRDFQMSVGDVIFPYDALSTEEEDFTSVSLQIAGESEASTYRVNQFDMDITASSGIEYDEDTLVITDISADGTITFKYTFVVNTNTEAEVHHKYVVMYNGEELGYTYLDSTIANLTAPNGGSIALTLDSTAVKVGGVGNYTASQFTPVRVEAGNSGLEFGAYTDNGVFTPTKVPFNTPNAELTVVYELEVKKIVVNEKFAQNGVIAEGQKTTTVYAPVGSAYVFDSVFEPDRDPFQDGVTLDKYTASSTDVTLTNTQGGYATFTIDPVSADREITIVYDYATYAQANLNVVHEFYKNGVLVGTKTVANVATLTNDPAGTGSYTVVPFSGTVSGISGSISSAIVDADNYYANGMNSADANVSVAGYTVTYINDEATGTQPDIDVVVRYDITDTATVTVNHKYYINGTEVTANVTNAPTTSLTLVKGASQAITVAQGTVTYYGTTFNLSDFAKTVVPADASVVSANGLNVTLNKFNVATADVTVNYNLTVRTITVKEIFKDSTTTYGTETSTLYVADGESYTFTSVYNSYNGVEISNYSKTISDGYTLGAGDVATFTSTATGDAEITITYTVGTQATVTVDHKYYINGTEVTPNVTNEPTAKLVLNKGIAQSITIAQGTVVYNGTTFNLADFTATASTASDGIGVSGFDVTLNKFNVTSGAVTVRYDLTVREITVTEIFKDSTSTYGTETSKLYVADGDSYTFTSGYNAYNGIAISEYAKAISDGYTLGAGDVATFTATATADANVTITYTVDTEAVVNVEHKFYINGVEVDDVTITNAPTTSLTLVMGVSQSIPTLAQGTVAYYNNSSFDISGFTAAVVDTDAIEGNGTNATLKNYNVADNAVTVTVRYDLTVRMITVKEIFKNSTGVIGTEEATLYVADGDSYTFTSSYNAYNGIAISYFSKAISDGYVLGAGDVATFTSNATADTTVTITYTVGTQADVTVNHEFYINGNPVDAVITNDATANLVLNYGSAQTIVKAQGTVNYNGTIFNLSDFAATATASSNSFAVDGMNVTLTEYNVATGTVTVRYDLTVYTINVTETFVKDGDEVATATKTAYIKAGDSFTFTSDYNASSVISDVALGNYIRTAEGATVTTDANGAATFTANADANVAINYAVSTKSIANVEYVYIVNGAQVTANDFAGFTAGAGSMNLVYGQAVSAPSANGTYVLGSDSYTLASDFTKTVTVSGAATATGNDVTLDAYNVADNTITVTVTYEIAISNEADVNVYHTYYINGVELTGSALANVVTGTTAITLEYGVTQTINKSTGTVVYNGTEFRVSDFDVTVADYNPDILSMNGLAATLIRHNVGSQKVTLRYDLTVYTVVVNENFYINGVAQTESNVTNTYYVSAKTAALVANLVNDSVTVNGIEVGNFITSVTDNSDAIEGALTPANRYEATVNGSGIVTVDYNISTITSVNVTSKFLVNGSADGIDTSNVTNATSVQTGFEYGVSKQLALAGGYVIWNGIQFEVSNFTATITNYDVEVAAANGLNLTVNKYNTAETYAEITYSIDVTTTADATVTHEYYFNGEKINPVITSAGSTAVSLTYGVSTPIALTQGTYEFNGTVFNLSDADITVTATPDIIDVDGSNVTLNTLNVTETAITVRYDLSTVVVNITEVVVTDDGAHTETIGERTFYMLDDEVFSSFTSTFDTVVVNGVTIPYNLFTRTVTGAEAFNVTETDTAITISGKTAGQTANIVITYSGVKTTGNVRIASRYYYKNGASVSMINATTGYDYTQYVTVNVGDRIQLSDFKDISFKVSNAQQIINTSYFYAAEITANGFSGYVDEETNEFVVTSIEPNMAGVATDIYVKWCIDLYADVTVVHEFYVNNKLFTTVTETATEVPIIAANQTTSSKFKIAQMTSGTISANGTSYNIAELIADGTLTVDDSLIQTTGLVVARGVNSSYKNKFAVQSYDIPIGDDCEVVIRYDILTTLEEAGITVNSTYVNNGEVVGELSNSTVTTLKLGDVIANETVKTVNGVEITFTVQSVVANGVTVVEENGVYTITEIDPSVTEWSIDITYVANVTASVKVTHNFYVAGKLLGTITDNTVVVNIAEHSGKFVALNGIVGVTTDKGVVYVDANRFVVTLANGADYGTFANDVFTLNASAFNGSTYEIAFNYDVDGITYAIDGEAGIKQNATSTNVDGQYNVITTVTSVGNYRPIDIIFVVDVSAGMGDISNEQLDNAKAEISEYITNSFAVNNNVRVAIVTYADGYEVLAGGYITDKDTALATVAGITLAEAKDGYDVTASNLQAGLYGARMLMRSDVRRAYTDVIVIKGSEANAAYSQYNTSYNYSVKVDAAADEANAAANYELSKMNASKVSVIDLTNAETNVDATMTEIFDARNYINIDGKLYITVNSDEFTFVDANGVTVNGNAVAYNYEAGVLVIDLGTIKDAVEIEYTLELTNKVDGDYFVSDEIKLTYFDAIDNATETMYGVSARVSYSSTVTGATITVIAYHANSQLNPVGMDGLTVKNFYEDAIIGKPVVYAVSGVTNLTAGETYDVKAPIISGYTLWDNEESVKTIVIPAEGENAVVYFGYYASGALVDDSVVYDDAADMVFDVLDNDTRPTGEGFDAIYGIGATEAEAMAGNTTKVETAYGSLVTLDNGNVKYTPNGITVTGEFYYAVQDGDEIRVAKIYVVPATIVKADISSNEQITAGDRWQIVDENGNVVESDNVNDVTPNDTDNIYGGYDENESNNFGFDGNDALYANRYQDYINNGKVDGTDAQYTATFTFTGTGFDIISVTGKAGGYVTIKTWDSNGNLVSNASGNLSTFALTENIYQATIFTCTNLTLDTYTVEVIAQRTYLPRLGMTDTQVYIDSARTYNPFANNTNEHYNDLHNGTKTETLKDIFVDGNLAVSTEGNGLFTQSGMLDINSYMDKATNNTINILAGQSLLFKLDDASVRTSFQVEMSAVDSSATVEVYVNSKLVETLTIDTGVFAYYDFSKYIREDSTVNFKVVGGQLTFSKVRYKDAVLGEPEGEKYTTADLATQATPDGELMSDDYTVNTGRLVKKSGTTRTITTLVYTSTNADSVIIYTNGYRIAPTSVTVKTNSAGTQNQFMITYTLPDDIPVGEVVIDFYAYDTASNTYSSNYKTATYTLK